MIPGSFGFRPCNQRTSESSLSAGHTMASRSDSLGAQLPPERRAGWAELLGASGSLELRLRGENSEWKASVPRDGTRPDLEPLLAELLFQLHSDGLIDKVSGSREPDTSAAARPAAAVEGIDLDVRHIKTDWDDKEKEEHEVVPRAREMTAAMKAALTQARSKPVRRLMNLDCYAHEEWGRQMLEAVAPHVEELYMDQAELKHLKVVSGMAALKKLYLRCGDVCSDAPPLPPQLEDVYLYHGSLDHILSIQRMPRLRKLTLSYSRMRMFPPVPPHHVGLEFLIILGTSSGTDDQLFSLIRAHGATLQELHITTSSYKPKSILALECFYEDLAARLGQCGLRSLKRLLLVRTPALNFGGGAPSHSAPTCAAQIEAICAALRGASSMSNTIIACTECHGRRRPEVKRGPIPRC